MKPSVSPGVRLDTITIDKYSSAVDVPARLTMSINEISKVTAQAATGMMGKYFLLNAKKKARVLLTVIGQSNGTTAKFKFQDQNTGVIVNFTSGTHWTPNADADIECASLFNAMKSAMNAAGWTGTLFGGATGAMRWEYVNFDINVATVTDAASTGYLDAPFVEFHGGSHRYYCYFDTQDGPSIDPNEAGALDVAGKPPSIPVHVVCNASDTAAVLAATVAAEFNASTNEFTATAVGTLVTITHTEAGAIGDIADGNTGWTMSVDTQGA